MSEARFTGNIEAREELPIGGHLFGEAKLAVWVGRDLVDGRRAQTTITGWGLEDLSPQMARRLGEALIEAATKAEQLAEDLDRKVTAMLAAASEKR